MNSPIAFVVTSFRRYGEDEDSLGNSSFRVEFEYRDRQWATVIDRGWEIKFPIVVFETICNACRIAQPITTTGPGLYRCKCGAFRVQCEIGGDHSNCASIWALEDEGLGWNVPHKDRELLSEHLGNNMYDGILKLSELETRLAEFVADPTQPWWVLR